jgi:hypothetical protein
MIAVSNFPTAEKIHSIIDRHRTAALPFAGSSLLSAHYHEVPLLSIAWGVGQVGLPFSESGAISVLGLSLPIQDDSTIIASVTPGLPLATSVHLRVEEIAPDEAKAASQAAALSSIVLLARDVSIQLSGNAANNAFREVLKTTQVSQKRNRVIATATVSPALLSQVTESENSTAEPATPQSDRASSK